MSDQGAWRQALREDSVAVCTTPVRASAASEVRARQAADWFGVRFVPRRRRSLEQVFHDEAVDVVLVAEEPLHLYVRNHDSTPVFVHPGMAHLRILQWQSGAPDRLLKLAGVRPGDTVLDVTFGLGTDSLVFAAAVGPAGHVIGVESSPWLVGLFTYAQQYELELFPDTAPLQNRIELVQGDHEDVLQSLPDGAVDIVYFDPMFRTPLYNGFSNIESARPLTNPKALSKTAFAAAPRVARRAVVVKERPDSGQFERLGLHPDKTRAKVAFGVWRKEQADG